ncbi:MAG: type II secretion system protein [Pseudomonadota bacterium]
MNRLAANGKRERGVILLEVVVAFAILAVALSALLQSAGANSSRQRAILNQVEAATHAANIISRLGTDLKLNAGEQSGEIDDKYSWSISIATQGRAAFTSSAEDIPLLVEINVVVTWQERGRDKQYFLNTKRIVGA